MIPAIIDAGRSGLVTGSRQVDIGAHNLANVSTTGFKAQLFGLADLPYVQVVPSGKPVYPYGPAIYAGSGGYLSSTGRLFGQGPLMETGRELDLAILGRGFFRVELADGTSAYTRDGSFHLDGEGNLVTSAGWRLFGELSFGPGATDISVSPEGRVSYRDESGEVVDAGSIVLYDFLNPEGLEAVGGNLFRETEASGPPLDLESVTVKQGFLEASGVRLEVELVNLIIAQRAYEFNARVVAQADEMWELANGLVRG